MKAPTLFATFIGLIAGVVMTWPMMTAPGSLARMDSYDGKFSVWNVAWVAHALVDDPSNVFNANIFYPHTGTLAYSEANLVAGAIAAGASRGDHICAGAAGRLDADARPVPGGAADVSGVVERAQ